MSDSAKRELMVVVERAVRPVRASIYRKRRMREELLEHLSAVFDNEMELQSDIPTALERAKRRFGDPAKLTEELQQAVPWWDRMRSVCNIVRLEPCDSLLHFFAKLTVLLLATLLAFMLVMWPAMELVVLPSIVAGGEMENMRGIIFVLVGIGATGMFFVVLPFIIVSAVTRIKLALFGEERQRSNWMAVRWMLAAVLVSCPLVLYTCAIFFVVREWGIALSWLACFLSLAFTLWLLAKSRQATDAQWASLEVDE